MCVHGSNVVYKAPFNFYSILSIIFRMRSSIFEVTPEEITVPFLTITQPTDGFVPVWPTFSARWKQDL